MMLPDPEVCRRCCGDSRVIDSRNDHRGYRWRRHQCMACSHRWTTWQTVIDPRDLTTTDSVQDGLEK